MFVRAHVPKSRTSLTPQNFKPICIEQRGDCTPTRSNNISYYEHSILIQEPSQQSLQNYTGRVEEKLQRRVINSSASNLRCRYISDKENLVRVPGQSFGGNQPSSKDLMQVMNNLKKQKEDINYTLSETLQKNNLIQEQMDIVNKEMEQQSLNYQQSLDEFMNEFNELTYKISQLEEQNNKLFEQNEHQKWYLQQIQCQSSRFHQTHNFGAG
ncbi:unnamed protein product (macronuclear) [Paramecium tetraurelia]|uniref:Uncharacterized protein n=1 Tax=Paramecium tetraurelia TaxID=5888 RepID=A0DS23_PARTE|nr:uncharacterized protein GSPATT00019544001 [Paramecium tetraurelia]CAK85840.1 unnamed protein product [Paramecium tetraurelia]|eukprot:XP_001453237.1 hypothetical protein (macronuclear) [Paramecium tetraurelia strain d4-2]